MFRKIKNSVKNFINGEDLFSNLSVLSFSNYKKNYSSKDFLSAYELSLYVNVAINKRAAKVGEIEFVLSKGDKKLETHEVLDLLAKPNKSFSGFEFWSLYQKYYDIFGEVYILTDSELRLGGKTKVNELHLLRSDFCTPIFEEKSGELLRVEHKTKSGTEVIDGENIIYVRNPNPSNPLRGESLLCSGMKQIETLNQIDEYHAKILENGGRVEGVFNLKTETLTKTQLTELKEQFQEEYGNASKAGLPLFLAGGANYEKLALSPAELAYLETKKVLFNDIVKLTGVPSALMGETSGETFSNADASIRIFLRETIKPLLVSLCNSLNEKLVGEDLELSFVDPTPEDKEEIRKDIETGIKNYILTPNEARELMGLEPRPEGDKLLAPFNIAPLGMEKETLKKKELSCDCGDKKKESKAPYHPLRDITSRRLYHSLQVKRLDRRWRKMEAVINDYFAGQERRLVEKLQATKKFRKKDLFTEIFNTSIEIKLAKESVLPLLESLMKEAAEDAKEIAGSDWEFNDTAEINAWLDKKTSIFAEQITDTTFNKLKEEFKISFGLAETRKELIERIKDTYGDISKGRAETIARTEVHGVTQYGTVQGYKQAGMPIKIWVWAPGTKGGVREDHQSIDGEEVPIDSAFSNGLMFPGDPNGGAGETINCQCFI